MADGRFNKKTNTKKVFLCLSTMATLQSVLISGATSGIGRAASFSLAAHYDRLYFIARNKSKAEELADELSKAHPSCELRYFLADLSSMEETARVGEEIRATTGALDTVILNAGILGPEKRVETPEGHELTFATNHLSVFLLAHKVLPLLEKSPRGRIITTSSEAHRLATFNRERILSKKKYSPLQDYAISKLCNILFTIQAQKEWGAHGISCHAFHPGGVNTNFGQGEGGLLRKMAFWMAKPFFISPEEGASTLIHLATTDAGLKHQGQYWNKKKIIKAKADASDPRHAKTLWDLSEALVKSYL